MGQDLRQRIEELEAELAAARGDDTTAPQVPTITVDSRGTVVGGNGAWFDGGSPPERGSRLVSVFTPGSAARIQRCADLRWVGASELTLRLADGRAVGLAVLSTQPERWVVVLHDITARHVLDAAVEERRQLAMLADLAASLARELADPMSIVQGRLELLMDLGVTDADATQRHLGVALEHARRVAAILRNLRRVGHRLTPTLEAVGVAALLDEALELLGPRRERVAIEIEPVDLQAGGEMASLARVLASLLRYALEGAGRSGVLVTVRRVRGSVLLMIGPRGRPRGPNHPSDDVALDEALLRSVGGTLRVFRSQDELHVEVALQAAPATRLRARPVEGKLLLVGGASFHDAVRAVLDKDGFAFLCMSEARDALAALDEEIDGVDAVVAELLQGKGPSGLALSELILDRYPMLDGRVLVVSPSRMDGLPASVVPVSWPLRRSELLEALGRRVRRR